MRQINAKELREIQLEILDTVADFCEKNAISYWIDSGTLLGAIRHKGYIPWDDDIDIGMLRPDYDRFLKLFNASNSRYQVHAYEIDPNFLYPFAKVLDTRTVMYEPDENGNKLSVNIDIFIYDNAPEDSKQLEQMYKRRDMLNILHMVRNRLIGDAGSTIRRILLGAGAVVLSAVPEGYFVSKMVANSKRFADADMKHVGNFTAVSRILCEKSIFDSFIQVEFEGKLYRAPVGYDAWLRAFYKEYMQLPPKEKQVSHHAFVAYCKDENE